MSRPRPDIELLAALDADQVANALDDPAARPVLDALAATRAELAALPDPPVPAAVAARWSTALRTEIARLAEPGAPPTTSPATPSPATPSPATPSPAATPEEGHPSVPVPVAGPAARRRTGRRSGRPGPGRNGPAGGHAPGGRHRARPRPAVVAVVALLLVLAASAVPRDRPGPTGASRLVGDAQHSIGIHDAGAFTDDAHRAACLAVLAPPDTLPTAPLLGGRQVTFAGRPGVLLVLGTGRLGVLDVVVVDRGCTTLLAAGVVGG